MVGSSLQGAGGKGMIRQGDVEISIFPANGLPALESEKEVRIKDNNDVTYSVELVTRKAIGDTVLKYVCQCRKV
jgi:hypothetical protein